MRTLFIASGALIMASMVNPALAQSSANYMLPNVGVGSAHSSMQSVFSLGVQWDFGDKRPDLVAAVRRTQTYPSSRVIGSKVDLTVPLTFDDGFQPRIRALALAGNRAAQGEGGIGVRVSKASISPIVAAGAQLPNVNGGANFIFGDGLKPYLGVNSIKRAVAPARKRGPLSCDTGVPQVAVEGDPAEFVIDGMTCYNNN